MKAHKEIQRRIQVLGRSLVIWRQEEHTQHISNVLRTERRVWKVTADC